MPEPEANTRSLESPPVALIIFKRPEQTRRVFDVIRQVRPSRLFVIADGPRNEDERLRCEETRAIVVDHIDWPCEVTTDFAQTNMGLRRRLVSGITWVFEQVEEAIFIEDDCLPDPTFFRFCAELLDRYRDDLHVMHISGNCFVEAPFSRASYYFTRYAHVWGWASWRRAWEHYDGSLAGWNDRATRNAVLEQCQGRSERRFWKTTLDAVQRADIDTWDYQWAFTLMAIDGKAINPTVNLVQNIGFGEGATHTKNSKSPIAALTVRPMEFPLVPPPEPEISTKADREVAAIDYVMPLSWKRWVRAIIVNLFGQESFQSMRDVFRTLSGQSGL